MAGASPAMTKPRYVFQKTEKLGLAGHRLAECGLRRSETGDRHAIGRAGNIVQSDLVTEGDGSRIAAVFAANTDLEIRTGFAPARHADFHQLADSVSIDRDKGVDLQD